MGAARFCFDGGTWAVWDLCLGCYMWSVMIQLDGHRKVKWAVAAAAVGGSSSQSGPRTLCKSPRPPRILRRAGPRGENGQERRPENFIATTDIASSCPEKKHGLGGRQAVERGGRPIRDRVVGWTAVLSSAFGSGRARGEPIQAFQALGSPVKSSRHHLQNECFKVVVLGGGARHRHSACFANPIGLDLQVRYQGAAFCFVSLLLIADPISGHSQQLSQELRSRHRPAGETEVRGWALAWAMASISTVETPVVSLGQGWAGGLLLFSGLQGCSRGIAKPRGITISGWDFTCIRTLRYQDLGSRVQRDHRRRQVGEVQTPNAGETCHCISQGDEAWKKKRKKKGSRDKACCFEWAAAIAGWPKLPSQQQPEKAAGDKVPSFLTTRGDRGGASGAVASRFLFSHHSLTVNHLVSRRGRPFRALPAPVPVPMPSLGWSEVDGWTWPSQMDLSGLVWSPLLLPGVYLRGDEPWRRGKD
ncbi:hypothetical protein K456DRAFT_28010 [Colletotrichum gloeosporioides 23]|nr:hypothetical protein K456DRAFT_28010 [Colletotrichum gloeosporioides 23]